MKKNLIIYLAIIALGVGCNNPIKKAAQEAKQKDPNVVREYFSNGKVKTETAVKGNLRHGLTKNFDRNGMLVSQVNYVDNVKDGQAINFYATTGKINSTMMYKNGIKEGDETWNYESGKVCRVSPYVKGKIEGTQKFYFESGKLMAEVPYKNGLAGVGTKEYKEDGSPNTNYPDISFRREDHIQNASKILLFISLTQQAFDVKFYQGTPKGGFITDNMMPMSTQNGIAEMDFNVPAGSMVNKDVVITASYRWTKLGITHVITKKYHLSASH
jgi:antitoxin component YwqK of YwqJK toxin-antitoxin module